MHGNDGLGPRRDGAFEQGGVHGEGPLINVDEDGLGTAIADRLRRRHERAGHGDHLITGADAKAEECQPQGIRSVADPNGESGLTIGGKVLLKLFDKGTAGKRAPVDDLLDGSHNLPPEGIVLGSEIKERHFHGKERQGRGEAAGWHGQTPTAGYGLLRKASDATATPPYI